MKNKQLGNVEVYLHFIIRLYPAYQSEVCNQVGITRMEDKDSAVTILEDAFVISKLIMKYAGFWPLEPMRYSDTNTWQEKILWVRS